MLPAAVALLYLILSIQRGREAEVSTAALRGSHTAAIEVEEAIGNAEAVLVAASAAPVVRDLAPTCSAYLTEVVVRAPALSSLAVADSAGQVLCGTPLLPAGSQLSDGDWTARLPADGSRAVGTFTPAPGGAFLPIALRDLATGRILVGGSHSTGSRAGSRRGAFPRAARSSSPTATAWSSPACRILRPSSASRSHQNPWTCCMHPAPAPR